MFVRTERHRMADRQILSQQFVGNVCAHRVEDEPRSAGVSMGELRDIQNRTVNQHPGLSIKYLRG